MAAVLRLLVGFAGMGKETLFVCAWNFCCELVYTYILMGLAFHGMPLGVLGLGFLGDMLVVGTLPLASTWMGGNAVSGVNCELLVCSYTA